MVAGFDYLSTIHHSWWTREEFIPTCCNPPASQRQCKSVPQHGRSAEEQVDQEIRDGPACQTERFQELPLRRFETVQEE